MITKNRKLVVVAIMLSVALLTAGSLPNGWCETFLLLPNGSKADLSATCPVCGMVVGGGLESSATYAYRDGHLTGFAGVAASVFKDGKVVPFEGARCLFIYNTIPKRFGINVEDIVHQYVTDFNTKNLIEDNRAVFVLGSPIKGFMGYDLVAFSTREEAEKFRLQHGGKRIVQHGTVGIADVERKTNPLNKK